MMSRNGKHRFPLFVRIILWLVSAAVLVYAGIIGYVCIREGSVSGQVPENADYDAIIVLGAQVRPDGTPSVQLTWRMDAAIKAYEKKRVPIVVCGARGADEPMTEAAAMKLYLTEKGIPEEDILTDHESFNTRQNLKNAAKLLEKYPEAGMILIVTSDYHVPRAFALAKDLGYEATGLGSPCKPEYWIKNHAREALAWCKYWGVKYLHLPLE